VPVAGKTILNRTGNNSSLHLTGPQTPGTQTLNMRQHHLSQLYHSIRLRRDRTRHLPNLSLRWMAHHRIRS